jgi:sec-independent protein translocase protein TatC
VSAAGGGGDPKLYFAPLEFFFTRVRLSVFAGVMLAFPIIAWQVYAFVAPGLYRRERKAAAPFLIAAPVLFALGASLVYFVMMPFVMRFAVGFESGPEEGDPAQFELLTRVGDYLSLVTTLMLGFGLAFQLPVFLTLLARAGIIDAKFLVKYRRFAIVIIFVVAAFLTPPDPFSQTVLACCIMALYEISVFAVRIAARKSAAAEPAAV